MPQFEIRFEKTVYTVNGVREVHDLDGSEIDLNTLVLSFKNQVIDDDVYLIHPEELDRVAKILSTASHRSKIDLSFKVIASDRRIKMFESQGILEVDDLREKNGQLQEMD